MTSHLFVFQIGPVQSFIAQARRTQDLYVGSRILSDLAAAGLWAAKDTANFQPIFPYLDESYLPRSVPHKFAFISSSPPEEIAQQVRQAVDERWIEGFANRVGEYLYTALNMGEGEWNDVYQRQVRSWLEFTWIAVPYDADRHGDSFTKAVRAMAQRKLARPFAQVEEPGTKCTLSGSQQALPLNWKALARRLGEVIVRPNEQLGAIATIKRFVQDAGCFTEDLTRFPSAAAVSANDPDRDEEDSEDRGREVEGYFAILHMDGDQMGTALSNIETLEQHQRFSRVLADFADNYASQIIAAQCRRDDGHEGAGVLVYAGGDDVLALLPLSRALQCADALRKEFEAISARSLPKGKLTMSAGMAIVPQKLPFDIGLEMARGAEDTAKDHYRIIDAHGNSKGAVYVVESHGSGRREAGGCWDDIGFVQDFLHQFASGRLSGKYGYDLLELHNTLGAIAHDRISSVGLSQMKQAEAERIIRRRASDKLSAAEKDTLKDSAILLADFARAIDSRSGTDPKNGNAGWERAANWVILARFLASDGKRGN